MGLPAHMPPERVSDNPVLSPVAPADTMMQQIEELLGADAPTLARLEETLTEGYAQALALEAERWRLERKIADVAARFGDEVSDEDAAELAKLGQRLSDADGDLNRLRVLLASLRTRADEVRAA